MTRASLGRRLLLTKITARTGYVYLFTASETDSAACSVDRNLFEKSITGLSVSWIKRDALGRQFLSLHDWK